MSKSAQEFILIIAGILVFIFVVWFVSKLIEAITHPSVVWFGIGFLAALVAEGIAWCIFRLKWKTWRFWRTMPPNEDNS